MSVYPDIDATCASLGYHDGIKYYVHEDYLNCLKVRPLSIIHDLTDLPTTLSLIPALDLDPSTRWRDTRLSTLHRPEKYCQKWFVADGFGSFKRLSHCRRPSSSVGEPDKPSYDFVSRGVAKGQCGKANFLGTGRNTSVVQRSLLCWRCVGFTWEPPTKSFGCCKWSTHYSSLLLEKL